MARTTAPLLSFDGAGQIGKSIVFARWRGISYARRFVIPANPRTQGQVLTRNVFSMLNAAWLNLPALLAAPWTAAATGQQFTDRNKFVGDNVRNLRDQVDFTDLDISPGARGGLNPTSVTATAGVGEITVDFTTPTPPDRMGA